MTLLAEETLQLPLGPADAGMPMTLDEFETADFETGHRYELIHGILIVTPPPLEEERDSNEELGHWLRNYQESHPQGKALDLTLPEQNIRTAKQNRRPDRAVWAGLGRRPRTRGPVARRDVPAILIEFASRRPADKRRDYEEKQVEYRDLGVKEYWIFDRFRRWMTIYSWQGPQWTSRVARAGEVYTTPILPGFELNLDRLLAIADRHRDAGEPTSEN